MNTELRSERPQPPVKLFKRQAENDSVPPPRTPVETNGWDEVDETSLQSFPASDPPGWI